jgi:4-amino-4-deoxy-L-arabinose transferase-like glycosyltransferase
MLNRYWLSGLILVSILLLFINLNSVSVFQVAEARNAQCAREMFERNDWVVPTFNGELRTDKPVLEYWCMMIAYHLFGVSEGSSRFFSAVCGLLTILSTFLFVCRHLGLTAARWSALALLSSLHCIIQFRLATPDPYLILFHTVTLFTFWEGFTSGKFKWYVLMYIAFGLSLLAKGPIGLLLPGLSIFLVLLFKGQINWPGIKQLKPWYGLFMVLLIAAPWYLLVNQRTNGYWVYGFLFTHNLTRFKEGIDDHQGIFLITFLFVILGMFPFSVFFVRSISQTWKRLRQNDTLLFTFISFASIVIFYSFSKTRLINYTAPCYPYFAIMLGWYIADVIENKPVSKFKIELIVLFIICLIMPIGAHIWLSQTDPLTSITWVSPLFAIPAIGATLALIRLKQHAADSLMMIAKSFVVFGMAVNAIIFPAIDSQTPMHKRGAIVRAATTVIAYHEFNNAFAFYYRQPIKIYDSLPLMHAFIRMHPNTLVISRSRRFEALDSLPWLQLISKDREVFSTEYSAIYKSR